MDEEIEEPRPSCSGLQIAKAAGEVQTCMETKNFLSDRLTEGDGWIDLTVGIRHEMVHYPGDPGVELMQTKHLDRGDPATVSHLSLGVHTGTHVDAPVHFIGGASGVDEFSIDALIGPARVIEILDKEMCTAQDLAAYDIQAGERLLLRTNNSNRCWNVDAFVEDYAYLDTSAAKMLAERQVRMVGIDYLSIGRGSEGPEVHRILLGAGVVVVEGLDLSQVREGPFDIICMPLKIIGGDGAPARVAVRRREETASRRRPSNAPAGTMRAVVVAPQEKSVRLVRRSVPRQPGGSEVLLRMVEVGICGTDREISAFHYGTPPPGSNELVIGHEALAEVVETGPEVTWARPGDLVVPTVRRPCRNPRCAACRQREQDFCMTGEFSERGILRADGFLCEYTIEGERFLVPVPRALERVAVLVEPITIAAKAADVFTTIHSRFGFNLPRMRGLILGAGPVGILAAMVLQAQGIETHVFSREPEDGARADLVRACGANYVSAGRTPLDRLAERIGKIDVVFEAVGVPEVAFGALATLAANGVLILSGVPAARGPVPADLSRWMRDMVLKNQVIFGTVNASRSNYEDAVRRLEQFMVLFPEAVLSLLNRVAIDQATDVLVRGRGIKDVVTLGGSAA
jgi:kynurenine formamidase/threonine dehydrogenase-like Zn-dependent dehydrogenase